MWYSREKHSSLLQKGSKLKIKNTAIGRGAQTDEKSSFFEKNWVLFIHSTRDCVDTRKFA
jgi:hypothetical protein